MSPVADFPQDKWDWILAINLTAPFAAMKAAIPHMKATGWGRIISTASAHSIVASPFKSAYVAAKHGVAGLTKTAALELATSGITVNCVSPGYVWTELVQNQIPDTMKARGLTRQQVIDDVLLQAQPTKQFRAARSGGRLRGVPVLRRGGQRHRCQPQHGRRLDRRLTQSPPLATDTRQADRESILCKT